MNILLFEKNLLDIYALVKVRMKMLMKDIKLTMDAIILDDCDTDTHGLQQATEFIKGIKELSYSENILPLHLLQY